jgi:hypothetical protein
MVSNVSGGALSARADAISMAISIASHPPFLRLNNLLRIR